MPHDTSAPSLPRRFGRYALFDFIGRGGMAEIYLARAKNDLGGARLCVVKQILPELAQNGAFAEMLIHEAKLAARLNHANIVQVFDLGRSDERLYIAMDYVEGFDLNDLLRRCSRAKVPLPIEFALGIVSDVLSGLDYAHRRTDDDRKPLGLVHRDVSPSNVLVSFEGEVKLCDFGIAKANDAVAEDAADTAGTSTDTSTDKPDKPDSDSEVDETIQGKAGYMSPEHARGEALDARADVFSVGVILWELLAGHRMYRTGQGKPSLIEQARAANVPALPSRNFPVEERLHAIVRKALAPSREARYASAQTMLRELQSYVADAKFVASPLRFGDWLVENFGTDIVAHRRSRERAVLALEQGAPVVLTPLAARAAPLPSPLPPAPASPIPSVPDLAPSSMVPSSTLSATVDIEPASPKPKATPPPPRPNALYFAITLVVALAAVAVVVALFVVR